VRKKLNYYNNQVLCENIQSSVTYRYFLYSYEHLIVIARPARPEARERDPSYRNIKHTDYMSLREA
jgi:hypothetical protein